MARVELSDASAPRRATLVEETTRAVDALEGLLGPGSPMDAATREAIAATCADVKRLLGRTGTNVAIVGERKSNALLDGLLARPVFGASRTTGEGPLIVVRTSERASCRAILRGGRAEEFELPVADEAPEPRPEIEGAGWLRTLFRRAAALLRSLLARRRLPLGQPADDGARRVRALVDTRRRADEVDEVWLTLPISGMPSTITVYDVRGMMARAADVAVDFVRYRTDAALLVLEGTRRAGLSDETREVVRRLFSKSPRILVSTSLDAADAARALGIDAGRLVLLPPRFGAEELAEKVLGEREVIMGARTRAALRLAQRGIDEAIERDDERDREVIARLESYLVVDRRLRRDQTRHRVGGASAGRAIRILQSVLSLFEAEFVPLCEERMRAVAAARSVDELRAAVAEAGAALGHLRAKLVAHAERFLDEAASRLGPPLLEDLEGRLESVIRDLRIDAPARPVWPGVPKVRLEDHLVADTTLTAGEALSADIGWADSFLRSFEKVKERCVRQLAADLEGLSHAVRTEILGSEPRVARSLEEALEAWLELSADTFAGWLEETIAAERRARDAARADRQRAWRADRDALGAHVRAMSARFR